MMNIKANILLLHIINKRDLIINKNNFYFLGTN